jgi:predicted AAA+ superfamily ATPase
LENLIAIYLKRNELETNEKLYYYKTKNNYEVDFLIEKNGKVLILIQVCYDLSNIETYDRETRSLLIAGRELDCENLLLINLEKESMEKYEYAGNIQNIKFVTAYNFLTK